MDASDLVATEFATHASSSQRLLPRPRSRKAKALIATTAKRKTVVKRLRTNRRGQRGKRAIIRYSDMLIATLILHAVFG